VHKRRQIIENIRTKLKTMPNIGGCWIQQVPPKRIAWPCLTLHADNETNNPLTIHEPDDERFINLQVTAWIRGTPDDERIDAEMDKMGLAIEKLMNEDFGASSCRLIQTDFITDQEEPEIHQLTITYQIIYYTPPIEV